MEIATQIGKTGSHNLQLESSSLAGCIVYYKYRPRRLGPTIYDPIYHQLFLFSEPRKVGRILLATSASARVRSQSLMFVDDISCVWANYIAHLISFFGMVKMIWKMSKIV